MSVGKAISNGGGDEICTPQWFFREHCRRDDYVYDLDVCATPLNSMAFSFFTEEADCLKQSWVCERFWCNPPWSNILTIAQKAVAELRMEHAEGGTFLVPARPETEWWRFLVNPMWCRRVDFIHPRLNYYYPQGWKRSDGTRTEPGIRNGIAVTSALIHLSTRGPIDAPEYRYENYVKPRGPEGDR